jgi:hypothetical protein
MQLVPPGIKKLTLSISECKNIDFLNAIRARFQSLEVLYLYLDSQTFNQSEVLEFSDTDVPHPLKSLTLYFNTFPQSCHFMSLALMNIFTAFPHLE